MNFNIRFAQKNDVPVILNMITQLAEFEKQLHEVVATESELEKTLFGNKTYAEVLLLEENSIAVGMALFFHNYSTFLAKPGIYLEDLLFYHPIAEKDMAGSYYKGLHKSRLKEIADALTGLF